MRPEGLEPPRVAPPAPKAGASASSATVACPARNLALFRREPYQRRARLRHIRLERGIRVAPRPDHKAVSIDCEVLLAELLIDAAALERAQDLRGGRGGGESNGRPVEQRSGLVAEFSRVEQF